MTFMYPFLLWGILPLLFLLGQSKAKTIDFIHSFILILLLISLARPIVPQIAQESKIDAKEIIIAIDVSYSMRAKDIKPSRYAFAKATISAFLANNPSHNIMLIAFTNNPLLLSPPTTDHVLVNIALKSLNPEFILSKGTSLKRLFEKIAKLNHRHKEVILISDGGEERQREALNQILVQNAISLHILALGSKEGISIETKKHLLLKDKEGNLVISRINPLLKTLDASYIEASSSPYSTARMLENSLDKSSQTKNAITKMKKQNQELYFIPLLFALVLFLLLHTKGIKYLLLVLSLLGIQAHASFLDDYHLISAYKAYEKQEYTSSIQALKNIDKASLQSLMLLAHTYYKQGKYKNALILYHSIRSKQKSIKQSLYYHIANSHALLHEYSKAKSYYAKALQLGEDEDSRYNLGLIALLGDKEKASLGIAHPKSQSNASSSTKNISSKEDTNEEDKPSTNDSGKGEGSTSPQKAKKPPSKLLADDKEEENPQPLGSKVYELINKGYMHEQRPW